MNYMYKWLNILKIASFTLLILGLIKPSLVIWGEQKQRIKALQFYGLAFLFIIAISGILAQEATVGNMVLKARHDVKESNYKRAVSYYEQALEKWSNDEEYQFNRKEINQEYINAKRNYVDALILNAEVAIKNSNLEKATKLLNEVKKYDKDNKRIKRFESQLKSSMN